MNTNKKPNRRWIMRQVAKGNIEAKCTNKLTDDYAFDNSNNFGRTSWMPARLNPARTWEEYTLQNGNTAHRCTNSDEQSKEGFMSFDASDFGWSSGGAYYNDDGTISLYGAGEHYNLRLVSPVGSSEEKYLTIPANLKALFEKQIDPE